MPTIYLSITYLITHCCVLFIKTAPVYFGPSTTIRTTGLNLQTGGAAGAASGSGGAGGVFMKRVGHYTLHTLHYTHTLQILGDTLMPEKLL